MLFRNTCLLLLLCLLTWGCADDAVITPPASMSATINGQPWESLQQAGIPQAEFQQGRIFISGNDGLRLIGLSFVNRPGQTAPLDEVSRLRDIGGDDYEVLFGNLQFREENGLLSGTFSFRAEGFGEVFEVENGQFLNVRLR